MRRPLPWGVWWHSQGTMGTPFPKLRLTRLPQTHCFFLDREAQATTVFWQSEGPHWPQVLQEAWPLGFQRADGHPAFLSCGSLEAMESSELLLPSSAQPQWYQPRPLLPGTGWSGSLLSPRLTCAFPRTYQTPRHRALQHQAGAAGPPSCGMQ